MSPIKIFKEELTSAFKESKWLPLITVFAALSSIIGPVPHISMIHVPFVLLCVLILIVGRKTIDKRALTLLLFLPLTILIAQPDSVFKSWSRYGLFAIVYLFISPLLQGEKPAKYRHKALIGMLLIMLVISFGSIICFFLGINYMGNQATGEGLSAEIGSGFGGLTIQSIALGQFCGMSILYLTYRALNKAKNERTWYWLAIISLFLLVLTTSSRSALLSTIAGMLIMIYQTNKQNGKFIKIIFAIIVGAMLTFPLWEGVTVGLQTKQESGIELGKYGSRTEKWTARIDEFMSSPVYGVGFAAQDPNSKDYYDPVTGTVEPGSSWLAILSMSGIIGFILVVSMFVYAYNDLKKRLTAYSGLLLGLLVFIALHMVAEGYIYAGGGPGCFIAWLIIGCANDAKYISEEEII